jgi:hypothetical protein
MYLVWGERAGVHAIGTVLCSHDRILAQIWAGSVSPFRFVCSRRCHDLGVLLFIRIKTTSSFYLCRPVEVAQQKILISKCEFLAK